MAAEPNSFDMMNLLWGLIMVPIGWIWNMIVKLSTKLDKTHERISDLEVHVAEKYVPSEAFNRFEERLFLKLNEIQSTLDRKQDK